MTPKVEPRHLERADSALVALRTYGGTAVEWLAALIAEVEAERDAEWSGMCVIDVMLRNANVNANVDSIMAEAREQGRREERERAGKERHE